MTKAALDSPETLLADWYRRARESQFAHYEAAKGLSRNNRILGIAVIALTSFVGTSVFTTLQDRGSVEFRVLMGIVSVVAAVLSSLQTFLRLSENAEAHRSAGVSYGALRREIEVALASKTSTAAGLNDIRVKLDGLSEQAPEVPTKVWGQVERQLRERSQG